MQNVENKFVSTLELVPANNVVTIKSAHNLTRAL
jgi:hypothetical protein